MTIKEYIETVSKIFQSEISSEHSYRSALEALVRELVQGIEITSDSKQLKYGFPHYIIQNQHIPLG